MFQRGRRQKVVKLRPITPEDANFLFQMSGFPSGGGTQKEWIEARTNDGWIQFIAERDGGRPVAWLAAVPGQRRTELKWAVHPWFQGLGYGSAAVKELLAVARPPVFARIKVINERSMRIARRLQIPVDVIPR